MFDRFWLHLNLETLVIPLGSSLGLGRPHYAIFMSFFRVLSISPIFDLVTTKDRYKDFPEDFSIFFPLGEQFAAFLVIFLNLYISWCIGSGGWIHATEKM